MKNKHSKIKIGLLSLLLLMLAAGTVLAIRGSDNTSTSAPGNTEADVNFSPPTEEDKKAVEDNKTSIVSDNRTRDTSTASLKTVTPIISDATQYDNRIEVRSYVPGIFEDNGSCTIIASKGSQTITKKVNSTKDATTTSCAVVLIQRSEFPSSGTWDVVTTYLSSTAKGSSAISKMEVN